MIIDAHVHLPVGEGLASLEEKKRRLLAEMARNSVDRCVLISDSELESEIGTADECVALFAGDDRVSVVAGISPFIAFEAQLEKLANWLRGGEIVGIKLFTGHEAFYLTDGRLEPVYALAERYDVPVLFHSGWSDSQYGDAPLAAQVAMAHPKLKLVCCHCYYPNLDRCEPLLALPNVYFDLSSVADDPAILDEIAGHARMLISAAPGRVLFGSDYSGCSQAEHLRFARSLSPDEATRAQVLAGVARKLYRIGAGIGG